MRRLVAFLAILLACFAAGPAAANPDGPVRSVQFEPTYTSIPSADDGADVWRVGMRVSLPIGSFVTIRGRVEGGRYLGTASIQGMTMRSDHGFGFSVHLFVPLTGTAARYFRGLAETGANPDGPFWSFSIEPRAFAWISDSEPGLDLIVPLSRKLSLGGGWFRREQPRPFGVRPYVDLDNDWMMLWTRIYLPLTGSARRYHREMSPSVQANPDGAVGTLVVEPRYAMEFSEERLSAMTLRVSAPLTRTFTLRAGFGIVRAITGLAPTYPMSNAQGSVYDREWRNAVEFGLSYYVPWSDGRASLAEWNGR